MLHGKISFQPTQNVVRPTTGAAIAQWLSYRLPIGRLGVLSTATEWIAVALLGQERSPQTPRQEAQCRLRPAANCRHQKKTTVQVYAPQRQQNTPFQPQNTALPAISRRGRLCQRRFRAPWTSARFCANIGHVGADGTSTNPWTTSGITSAKRSAFTLRGSVSCDRSSSLFAYETTCCAQQSAPVRSNLVILDVHRVLLRLIGERLWVRERGLSFAYVMHSNSVPIIPVVTKVSTFALQFGFGTGRFIYYWNTSIFSRHWHSCP